MLKTKKFKKEEKQRAVERLETLLGEFNKMILDLAREIETEEHRSGIKDKNHFAYSTYAKAALTRRENLQQSVQDLLNQLEEAKKHLENITTELYVMESDLEHKDLISKKLSS